jgi:hypothetical protein
MATNRAPLMQIGGIALVVIGIGLIVWGYQMSDSVVSQVSEAFTGSETDDVMIRYIGGAASLVVGLFLLFKR